MNADDITALREHVDYIELKMKKQMEDFERAISARVSTMEEKLDHNNNATDKVLEILEIGKGFFKFCRITGRIIKFILKWTGIIAAWLLAVYGVLYAIFHGGRPPS